jgi:hypothetical protein
MICALLWGGMAWVGLGLEIGVQSRVGSVQLSQAMGTIVFPLLALLAFLVPSVLLSQTRFALAGNLWCILWIIPLFLYILSLDGGM